jgi:hypothetical protein
MEGKLSILKGNLRAGKLESMKEDTQEGQTAGRTDSRKDRQQEGQTAGWQEHCKKEITKEGTAACPESQPEGWQD